MRESFSDVKIFTVELVGKEGVEPPMLPVRDKLYRLAQHNRQLPLAPTHLRSSLRLSKTFVIKKKPRGFRPRGLIAELKADQTLRPPSCGSGHVISGVWG